MSGRVAYYQLAGAVARWAMVPACRAGIRHGNAPVAYFLFSHKVHEHMADMRSGISAISLDSLPGMAGGSPIFARNGSCKHVAA